MIRVRMEKRNPIFVGFSFYLSRYRKYTESTLLHEEEIAVTGDWCRSEPLMLNDHPGSHAEEAGARGIHSFTTALHSSPTRRNTVHAVHMLVITHVRTGEVITGVDVDATVTLQFVAILVLKKGYRRDDILFSSLCKPRVFPSPFLQYLLPVRLVAHDYRVGFRKASERLASPMDDMFRNPRTSVLMESEIVRIP